MSDFMRFILTLCFIAVAGLAPLATAAETAHVRPNVLFIAVDDLNDWINCLGGRKNVHTPISTDWPSVEYCSPMRIVPRHRHLLAVNVDREHARAG